MFADADKIGALSLRTAFGGKVAAFANFCNKNFYEIFYGLRVGGGSMEASRLRLFEITQTVKGDPLGNALMDEVLTSCFDHAMGRHGALERLVAAMNRFNHYLSGYSSPVSLGLFRGTPDEISNWAEQLTSQILANGEQ